MGKVIYYLRRFRTAAYSIWYTVVGFQPLAHKYWVRQSVYCIRHNSSRIIFQWLPECATNAKRCSSRRAYCIVHFENGIVICNMPSVDLLDTEVFVGSWFAEVLRITRCIRSDYLLLELGEDQWNMCLCGCNIKCDNNCVVYCILMQQICWMQRVKWCIHLIILF
jgi:hypothetical protein